MNAEERPATSATFVRREQRASNSRQKIKIETETAKNDSESDSDTQSRPSAPAVRERKNWSNLGRESLLRRPRSKQCATHIHQCIKVIQEASGGRGQ